MQCDVDGLTLAQLDRMTLSRLRQDAIHTARICATLANTALGNKRKYSEQHFIPEPLRPKVSFVPGVRLGAHNIEWAIRLFTRGDPHAN